MEYTQEPLFYTAEEVASATSKALTEAYKDIDLRTQRAVDHSSHTIAEALVEALREGIKEGELSVEYAQAFYDRLRTTFLWAHANLSTRIYTVYVTLDGDLIAEIEEVEADDEDKAIEYINDEFHLYNANVTLTFRDGSCNEYEHELVGVEHELSEYRDSLDFRAEEQ
jgi:hypothetical protein